jgi:hypothetical protein
MNTHPYKQVAGIALSLLSVAASAATSGFSTYESAGMTAASITTTRDAFRDAVGGGSTAGANGSFGGVRREINWDGVPNARADSALLPNNFFNVNSPRGAVFSTPGDGFMVSANAGQGNALAHDANAIDRVDDGVNIIHRQQVAVPKGEERFVRLDLHRNPMQVDAHFLTMKMVANAVQLHESTKVKVRDHLHSLDPPIGWDHSLAGYLLMTR